MLDMNVINRPSMNTLAVGEETGLLALAQDLVPRWSCSGLASCGCCLEGDRFKSLALDLSAEAGGLISMGALHNANAVSSVSRDTRRVPVWDVSPHLSTDGSASPSPVLGLRRWKVFIAEFAHDPAHLLVHQISRSESQAYR